MERWLYSLRRFDSERDLRSISYLLSKIGSPHEKFNSIHVTGTNGKGSTVAMITSILLADGYRVGMFTSPHLSSFTERIMVDGIPITRKDITRIIQEIKPHLDEMTFDPNIRSPIFFDVVTAIAFKYFAEKGVEFAVVEVGIGGKLDATNIITPLVSVITNIGLEHTGVLGNTLLEIAEKKAGIIKTDSILVTATKNEEVLSLFKEKCRKMNSRIYHVGHDIKLKKLGSDLEGQSFSLKGIFREYENLFIPLLGYFQLYNSATAVGAIEALELKGRIISNEAIEKGLKTVVWPGRLEIIRKKPLVVLDCMKDLEAAEAIKRSLMTEFDYERLIAVVSFSSDKRISEMIDQLSEVVDFFFITAHGVMRRAAEPLKIAEEVERNSKSYKIIPKVKKALKEAINFANEKDMIIVIGSVFLVGEARDILMKEKI
jgi:dihydrofolate synthase/folylpolyglutamate synthase